MTEPSPQIYRSGGSQDEPLIDGLGAVSPDGADLEVEPPDDDSRLLRLAEDFLLLTDDTNLDLF